jgi:predicted  nucleic acid-binding Zn-ribbon protein
MPVVPPATDNSIDDSDTAIAESCSKLREKIRIRHNDLCLPDDSTEVLIRMSTLHEKIKAHQNTLTKHDERLAEVDDVLKTGMNRIITKTRDLVAKIQELNAKIDAEVGKVNHQHRVSADESEWVQVGPLGAIDEEEWEDVS